MGTAISVPSGDNRQGWSFLVVRDSAKRARFGELYREAWGARRRWHEVAFADHWGQAF